MTQLANRPQNSAPPLAPPGRAVRTLLRWLMRPARVAAVETHSPHFRLVHLEGEALRNVAWTAGQKVQVSMGSGLSARTYTPMSWDADRGRTRMLTFAHGEGPGSRWANGLHEDDTCQFFGPRRSLDLSGLESPVVLFGDEPRSAWPRHSAIARRVAVQSTCSRPRMSRSRGRCWRRSASAKPR